MVKNKVAVIIDTDLGADCDDVGTLVLALQLEKHGFCDIKAVGYCTTNIYGVQCVDIVRSFYGGKFPIGMYYGKKVECNEDQHIFDIDLVNHYKDLIKETNYIEAYKLYRKVLAEAEDDSIIFITIGELTNAANLVSSLPDEISPLSGQELFAKKVKYSCVMGGLINDNHPITAFNNNEAFPEYNIVCAIEDAQKFVKISAKPIYFLDFYVGADVFTGKKVIEHDEHSPMKFAYLKYANGPSRSWDLLAVYYAITKRLYRSVGPGVMHIDDNGFTTFTKDQDGHHYYLRPIKSNEEITKEIDEALVGNIL